MQVSSSCLATSKQVKLKITVENGYVRVPDVPGVAFEAKQDLYAVMSAPAVRGVGARGSGGAFGASP